MRKNDKKRQTDGQRKSKRKRKRQRQKEWGIRESEEQRVRKREGHKMRKITQRNREKTK